MQGTEIHDCKFLKILWDGHSRIIAIDWKDTTAAMTDEDFKADLTLFADHVEERRAHGILVDVARFKHRVGAGIEEWRERAMAAPPAVLFQAWTHKFDRWFAAPSV